MSAAGDLRDRLEREAGEGGYHLNPDRGFTLELAEGLLRNTERYGYPSCPCRLASGDRGRDRDIICPCDYRDADLEEHGACFCALYVSPAIARGEESAGPVPERRGSGPEAAPARQSPGLPAAGLAYPVWRCRVCGYLCARDHPPGICPVCKASKDRFEVLIPGGQRETASG
jgi:ferredoxin-thioredoxin reductase catalytic subunit/rubredoxin